VKTIDIITITLLVSMCICLGMSAIFAFFSALTNAYPRQFEKNDSERYQKWSLSYLITSGIVLIILLIGWGVRSL